MGNGKASLGIVGAGMGGLAAAATLRQVGFDVRVYEQAPAFARVGAGVQMMPNSMKVLRGIGVEATLRGAVPPEIIQLDKKLVGLEQSSSGIELRFADGTRAQADAVIGADGVHSVVRDIIIGPDMPIHGGRIAYRSVFSRALLNGFDIGPSRTKWWGPDRHIVIYYVNPARSELYFVTSVPEPAEWMTP